jgi:uncharacterized LabA/DUF88 family protein
MSTITAQEKWQINVRSLMVFLREKYGVSKAYYYVGNYLEPKVAFYQVLSDIGYVVMYRDHDHAVKSAKKGNVDTDIVFQMMHDAWKRDDFDKIVLISGDGDYARTVHFLIREGRFAKVLLPTHKNASWLYRKLEPKWFTYLDVEPTKRKLKR